MKTDTEGNTTTKLCTIIEHFLVNTHKHTHTHTRVFVAIAIFYLSQFLLSGILVV